MAKNISGKIFADAETALADVLKSGMTIMSGGFGLCGIPEHLIAAIAQSGVTDLTLISNTAGVDDFGLGLLLQGKQVKKLVASYVGENKLLTQQYLDKILEIEFNPQGTLAERIRAGGAGIGGFYTKTGVGTMVAEAKPTMDFDGETYILETGLKADLALVKAEVADGEGNLIYRKTARNFNPMMAAAGALTIAEVEKIVATGTLDPDHIHTPGIYVGRLIEAVSERRVEHPTTTADLNLAKMGA